jgi:hypothetical protein
MVIRDHSEGVLHCYHIQDLRSGIVEDVLTRSISAIHMLYCTKAFSYATFCANKASGSDTVRWLVR